MTINDGSPLSDVAADGNDAVELLVTYEDRLNGNLEWAMEEGSRHFEQNNAVHEALRRITRRLTELGVSYAVAGGMAMFGHGFRRFTEDVDILVTREGLRTIHEQLEGRGYLPPFKRSKNLRDTEFGVRIEFLIAGQYPGDGKEKPVAFPNPEDVAVELNGICYLGLSSLIELKLASGMTSPGRAVDLGDVQRLIQTLNLRRELTDELNDYVRTKYEELWDGVRSEMRYVKLWRDRRPAAAGGSIHDIAKSLRSAADELDAMKRDGVNVDDKRSTGDNSIYLVTTDPDVAARYDMHPEADFMDEPEAEDE